MVALLPKVVGMSTSTTFSVVEVLGVTLEEMVVEPSEIITVMVIPVVELFR